MPSSFRSAAPSSPAPLLFQQLGQARHGRFQLVAGQAEARRHFMPAALFDQTVGGQFLNRRAKIDAG